MIDFHSHILPNIDDGSSDVNETFNLISEAYNAGFDKIIATSHYIEGYYDLPRKDRKSLIDAINYKLEQSNMNIKIYEGSEIFFTENIVELIENDMASSINNSKYVLFEFSLNFKPINAINLIMDLKNNGYIPILAHPERYSFVQNDFDLLNELYNNGVLFQSNFGSFVGQYGDDVKETVEKLLRNDMIHFLGSDVHREDSVYKIIPEASRNIIRIAGEKKFEDLSYNNPKKVLENNLII